MLRRWTTIAAAVACVGPTSLSGQRPGHACDAMTGLCKSEIRQPSLNELSLNELPSGASAIKMGSYGAILGGAGLALGWFVGRHGFGSDEVGWSAAALGESIALPLGVHIANGSQGSYVQGVGVVGAVASAALLYVLHQRTDNSLSIAVAITPLIQIPLAIAIERSSTSTSSR